MAEQLWVRVPVQYIGKVSHGAVLLIALLLNREDEAHEARVRIEALAEIIGCSQRNTERLLRELQDAGLIVCRKQLKYSVQVTLAAGILPPKRHGKKPSVPEPMEDSFSLSDFDLLVNRFD